MVVRLAREDEDLRGGAVEPRLGAGGRVVVHRREPREHGWIVHDEQPLPLAEAAARRTPNGGDNALERLPWDRLRLVVPDHAPALQQLPELHRLFVHDQLEQRAVGIAEVHARPEAAGTPPLDRPELDLNGVRPEVLDRVGDAPSHTKQRSLLPGRTGSAARGFGVAPGPWTFSCCPSGSR